VVVRILFIDNKEIMPVANSNLFERKPMLDSLFYVADFYFKQISQFERSGTKRIKITFSKSMFLTFSSILLLLWMTY
jgi:hypothetical protein